MQAFFMEISQILARPRDICNITDFTSSDINEWKGKFRLSLKEKMWEKTSYVCVSRDVLSLIRSIEHYNALAK